MTRTLATKDPPVTTTTTATTRAKPGHGQPHHARGPPPQRAEPSRCAGDDHAGQQPQPARKLGHRKDDSKHDRGRAHHQRDDRRQPPPPGIRRRKL